MNKTWTLALTIGLFAVGVTWAEEAATSTDKPAATAAEEKPAAAATPAAEETPASNPEIDKIEKACVEAWGNHKSMIAIVETASNMSGPNFSMSANGTGKAQALHKDDLFMSRMEMKMQVVRKMGENEQKMEQEMLNVSDGKVAYTLLSGMGQKQCFKANASNSNDFLPEQLFDALQEQCTLTVKPEAKLDGAEVYVIEGTPKNPSPMDPTKLVRVLLSKQYGIMLQQQALDSAGKPINTITFKDIKVDVPIEASVFEFEVPEGVQVIDQTGAS